MKILTGILAMAAPASAQAMGMHGAMARDGGMTMHLAVVLYAVLTALGYWVLQHAAKETANCVKRAGGLVGWALIVIGLLGVICGVVHHAGAGLCRECGRGEKTEMRGGREDDMERMLMSPVGQPAGRSGAEQPGKPDAAPKAAPKKK